MAIIGKYRSLAVQWCKLHIHWFIREIEQSINLNTSESCSLNLMLYVLGNNSYLENHATYKHLTVMLLSTRTFQPQLYPSASKCLGVSTAKKIHNPLSDYIDTVTLLYIQQRPSVLEAAIVCSSSSWSFTML